MTTDAREPATLTMGMHPSVATGSVQAPAPTPAGSPALVIGAGVTALGALRSLANVGIPTLFLPEARDMACRSRWARPLPGPFAALPVDLPLARVLERSTLEHAVILACSDAVARRVAALPAALQERFRPTVAPLDVLETFVDKRRFAAFLAQHGLPHPVTIELEEDADLDRVDARVLESAFLKPRDSQRFFARYGVKGRRVRDRAHARALVREFREEGLSMVLQEYVPGPPTSHVFLDGFVDRRGRLTHLLSRRRIRMFPEDFGNSTVCETVPHEAVRPAIDDLRRLLALSGHRGIFSAEVKRDMRDGVFRFLEVNARVWWYAGFAASCGVNVCEAAYRDALGLGVRPAPEPRAGIRLVYPSQDFAAFRVEHARTTARQACASTGEWFGAWIGAKQSTWSLTDPGPALWGARRWLTEKLGRTLNP